MIKTTAELEYAITILYRFTENRHASAYNRGNVIRLLKAFGAKNVYNAESGFFFTLFGFKCFFSYGDFFGNITVIEDTNE